MRCYTVYALLDGSGVRYVGMTGKSVMKRLAAHLRDASVNHRTNWLRSLDEPPRAVVLASRLTRDEAVTIEVFHIAHFRSIGRPLVNGTDGGDGTVGYSPSDLTRQRLSAAGLGKRRSPETRARMSAARKGMVFSDQHRANIGAATARRAVSDETRRKMSESQSKREKQPAAGMKHSATTKARMSARAAGSSNPFFGRRHSEETRAKISAAKRRE